MKPEGKTPRGPDRSAQILATAQQAGVSPLPQPRCFPPGPGLGAQRLTPWPWEVGVLWSGAGAGITRAPGKASDPGIPCALWGLRMECDG